MNAGRIIPYQIDHQTTVGIADNRRPLSHLTCRIRFSSQPLAIPDLCEHLDVSCPNVQTRSVLLNLIGVNRLH